MRITATSGSTKVYRILHGPIDAQRVERERADLAHRCEQMAFDVRDFYEQFKQ